MAEQKKNKRLLEAEALLNHPNVRAMAELISRAEGTTSHGYNTAFGGGKIESLAAHPKTMHSFTQTDGKKNRTSAAGRYQMIGKTWDALAKRLDLPDFSPRSQDLALIELMRENKALDAVVAGDFDKAAAQLGKQFASLPSSKYPQNKRDEQWLAKNIADIQGATAMAALEQTDPEYVMQVAQAATNATTGDVGALQTLAAIQNAKDVGDMQAIVGEIQNPFTPINAEAETSLLANLGADTLATQDNPVLEDALANLAGLFPAEENLDALDSVQSLAYGAAEIDNTFPAELLAQVVSDENEVNRQNAINSMFRRDVAATPLMELPGAIEAMITNFLEKSV